MFEVLHWRSSPPAAASPPPVLPVSLLERAVLWRDVLAARALLLLPAEPTLQLTAAFDDSGGDDVDWRRGCAALLCQWVQWHCAFTPAPDELTAWLVTRAAREPDSLARLLLVAAATDRVVLVREEVVPDDTGLPWDWRADPVAFATSLCAYDERLVRRFAVHALARPASHVHDALTQLNLCLPAWVATQVLSSPTRTAEQLLFFLRAARALFKMRSWNCLCLVMGALVSPPLQRLSSDHWEGLRGGPLWEELCAAHAQCMDAPDTLPMTAPATPCVVGLQNVACALLCSGHTDALARVCFTFASQVRRCTHAIPLSARARAHFAAGLTARFNEQQLMRASLTKQPETKGLRKTLASWFEGSSAADVSTAPLVQLTIDEWEAVFARAVLVEQQPIDDQQQLCFYRVRRCATLASGTIICGSPLPPPPCLLEQCFVSSLDSRLRVRVLRAYCISRADERGGRFAAAPVPPLLMDREQAARWSEARAVEPGGVVLPASHRCGCVYFLAVGECDAGAFFPGLDVGPTAVRAGPLGAHLVVVPNALLVAHTPLAVVVLEWVARWLR